MQAIANCFDAVYCWQFAWTILLMSSLSPPLHFLAAPLHSPKTKSISSVLFQSVVYHRNFDLLWILRCFVKGCRFFILLRQSLLYCRLIWFHSCPPIIDYNLLYNNWLNIFWILIILKYQILACFNDNILLTYPSNEKGMHRQETSPNWIAFLFAKQHFSSNLSWWRYLEEK